MNLVHVSSVSMYHRALKVSVATSGQRYLEKVKCLEYLLYGLANVVDVVILSSIINLEVPTYTVHCWKT